MANLALVPIALVLAELAAQLWWSQRYWSLGIPLFRASRKIGFGAGKLPAVADLELNFAGTLVPSLVFRQFDEHVLAFRESLRPRYLAFNYLPLMRGVIRFHAMDSSIEVRGYANWWFAVGTAALVAVIENDSSSMARADDLDDASLGALAFVAILFCALYAIQAVRFRNVAIEVAEMMDAELSAANRLRTT